MAFLLVLDILALDILNLVLVFFSLVVVNQVIETIIRLVVAPSLIIVALCSSLDLVRMDDGSSLGILNAAQAVLRLLLLLVLSALPPAIPCWLINRFLLVLLHLVLVLVEVLVCSDDVRLLIGAVAHVRVGRLLSSVVEGIPLLLLLLELYLGLLAEVIVLVLYKNFVSLFS